MQHPTEKPPGSAGVPPAPFLPAATNAGETPAPRKQRHPEAAPAPGRLRRHRPKWSRAASPRFPGRAQRRPGAHRSAWSVDRDPPGAAERPRVPSCSCENNPHFQNAPSGAAVGNVKIARYRSGPQRGVARRCAPRKGRKRNKGKEKEPSASTETRCATHREKRCTVLHQTSLGPRIFARESEGSNFPVIASRRRSNLGVAYSDV